MKRERVLLILITLLVLLNAATLFFIARSGGRPHGGPHGRGGGPPGRDMPGFHGDPARTITDRLDLSDSQELAFRHLRDDHHAAMVMLSARYDSLLHAYFGMLDRPYTPVERDRLEVLLAEVQRSKAIVTFDHFASLKSICRPEQQARFRDLLPEIMTVVAGERGPREGEPPPPPPR